MSAADALKASTQHLPLGILTEQLIDAALASPVVPARSTESRAVRPLIEAFLEGLGPQAEDLLSSYGDRAAARLVRLVTDEHRRHLAAPRFDHVVQHTPIAGTRTSRRKVSPDPTAPFSSSVAITIRSHA